LRLPWGGCNPPDGLRGACGPGGFHPPYVGSSCWALGRTLIGVDPSAAHRVASTVGRVQPAGRILLRLRAWRVSPALRLRSTHGPFNTSATVPRPAPSTARVTGRSAAANSAPW